MDREHSCAQSAPHLPHTPGLINPIPSFRENQPILASQAAATKITAMCGWHPTMGSGQQEGCGGLAALHSAGLDAFCSQAARNEQPNRAGDLRSHRYLPPRPGPCKPGSSAWLSKCRRHTALYTSPKPEAPTRTPPYPHLPVQPLASVPSVHHVHPGQRT